MGMGLIPFLLGFMLLCSNHKLSKFISDPRVPYKIWPDVSHVPRHWARVSHVSVLLPCKYAHISEWEALLQTPSTFEEYDITRLGLKCFLLGFKSAFTLQNGKLQFRPSEYHKE